MLGVSNSHSPSVASSTNYHVGNAPIFGADHASEASAIHALAAAAAGPSSSNKAYDPVFRVSPRVVTSAEATANVPNMLGGDLMDLSSTTKQEVLAMQQHPPPSAHALLPEPNMLNPKSSLSQFSGVESLLLLSSEGYNMPGSYAASTQTSHSQMAIVPTLAEPVHSSNRPADTPTLAEAVPKSNIVLTAPPAQLLPCVPTVTGPSHTSYTAATHLPNIGIALTKPPDPAVDDHSLSNA